MTCRECRWYDEPTCRRARSSSGYPARSDSKAVAHTDAGQDGRVRDAWLEVQPDFGCVQFEAETPDRPAA